MILRSFAGLACLALVLGTATSQGQEKSPDQQVKDLIEKYRALPEKGRFGQEGAGLLRQLKAVRGKLSPQSREAIARMETAHNLGQLALALQEDKGKDWKPLDPGWKPPRADPGWYYHILPYVEQRLPRPRWEYKVVSELDILNLGKNDLAAGLNKLGEESWELIGFEKTRFIFKRQK
jgi:hypothetical protein